METQPQPMLEAMIRHEEAIGALYLAFAEAFEEERGFWKRLAQEESHHAQWLSRLLKAADNGHLSVHTQRFHPAAIDLSIRHIDQQRELARQKKLTRLEALSEARSLESSLLEKGFLDPFEAVDPEAAQVLTKLQAATAQHREWVETAWQQGETRS